MVEPPLWRIKSVGIIIPNIWKVIKIHGSIIDYYIPLHPIKKPWFQTTNHSISIHSLLWRYDETRRTRGHSNASRIGIPCNALINYKPILNRSNIHMPYLGKQYTYIHVLYYMVNFVVHLILRMCAYIMHIYIELYIYHTPSGNQTWLAGKINHWYLIAVIPAMKTTIYSGSISQHHAGFRAAPTGEFRTIQLPPARPRPSWEPIKPKMMRLEDDFPNHLIYPLVI